MGKDEEIGVNLMSLGMALLIIGLGGLLIVGSVLFLSSQTLPVWFIVATAFFELLIIAGGSFAYLGVLFL